MSKEIYKLKKALFDSRCCGNCIFLKETSEGLFCKKDESVCGASEHCPKWKSDKFTRAIRECPVCE